METIDTKYFSQRAKQISLLNVKSSPAPVKSPSSAVYFQFSNRIHSTTPDHPLTKMGRGHGSMISTEHKKIMNTGRGRTTVPRSAFVLQKDKSPSSVPITVTTTTTSATVSSPIFVLHDEVKFVRPYLGPSNNRNYTSNSNSKSNSTQTPSASHKRDILLIALKEIESGLKTL